MKQFQNMSRFQNRGKLRIGIKWEMQKRSGQHREGRESFSFDDERCEQNGNHERDRLHYSTGTIMVM